jgi:hypothetical protein
MWESFLASVLFFAVLLVLGSGCYLWRRCALLSLFQVGKSKRLIIYLSRVDVVPGGSVGVGGVVRNFAGPTVTASEASAATLLAGLFEYLIPGLESQPGIMKTLFTRDISVLVQPSPTSVQQIPEDVSIVTVGSPGYNCVSEWAQRQLNPRVEYSPNNDALVTHAGRSLSDPATGMVQVLYDAQNDRRVFYVGGITEMGTRAGLLYLALNWRELKRNVGKQRVFAGLVRLSNGRVRLTETIH